MYKYSFKKFNILNKRIKKKEYDKITDQLIYDAENEIKCARLLIKNIKEKRKHLPPEGQIILTLGETKCKTK